MEAAILIGQAIQVALIIVGAFWLNYFVKQQLAAKDAEISYLKGIVAPELVGKIRAVSDFANETQRTIDNLTTEIGSANRQLASANEEVEKARLTGFGSAMLQASQLSNNTMRKALDVATAVLEARQLKRDDIEPLLLPIDNLTSTLLEATRTTLEKLKGEPGRPRSLPA
jgi:hypothetical protein